MMPRADYMRGASRDTSGVRTFRHGAERGARGRKGRAAASLRADRNDVTGHVPNGMTIEQAAAAGMDHIAHLPIRGDARSDEVNKTIAFLREHKTVIDPTQSWNELLGHAAGTPIAAFQPGVAKIPPPLNRLFSSAGADGIDAATARSRLERGLRIVKALHDAGVPVVVGTDEGIPGHSVHREIELYVEAGLTPLQALQAATSVFARALKLAPALGTIQRGK